MTTKALKNRPKSLTITKSVAYAASKEDSRPVLMHVHTEGGQIVAADGFRLHYAPNPDPTVTTCPVCKTGGYRYPDWQQIVPRKFSHIITVDSDLLRQAAQRAGIFAREGANVIRLVCHGDNLNVRGECWEMGESITSVPCDNQTGTTWHIGLNWLFLRDALDHCGTGTVTLSANQPNAPLLVSKGDLGTVIMPMNIESGQTPTQWLDPVPDLEPYYYTCSPLPPQTRPAPSDGGEWTWDTAAQTDPEPYYTASPDLTTIPTPDAQEHTLTAVIMEQVEGETASGHKTGKYTTAVKLITRAQPKETPPVNLLPCGVTRSELFSVYNRLKWAAKREGNTKMVERLNKALGILQSKNYYRDEPDHPRSTYRPTLNACGCKDMTWQYAKKRKYTGACKHILATWILRLVAEYRQEHRIDHLLTHYAYVKESQ